MPLFEIETDAHIIITWADDESGAREVVLGCVPPRRCHPAHQTPAGHLGDQQRCALGLTDKNLDPCMVARECLNRSAGDKVNAIRLYRMETGSDLEHARKMIESNMVMGW